MFSQPKPKPINLQEQREAERNKKALLDAVAPTAEDKAKRKARQEQERGRMYENYKKRIADRKNIGYTGTIPEGDELKQVRTVVAGAGLKEEFDARVKGLRNVLTKGIREDYPPMAREIIAKHGNEKIVNARVCRKPLQKLYQYVIKKLGGPKQHDEYFHLSFRAQLQSGKIVIIEKNENIRIRYETGKDRDSLTQCKPVGIANSPTINSILRNTEKSYPSVREYFDYQTVSNNCQRFVNNLVLSNGFSADLDFINQPLEGLLPEWVSKMSNFFTGFKARLNQLIEGYGVFAGELEGKPLSNVEIDAYYTNQPKVLKTRSHYGFKQGQYPLIGDEEYCVFNLDKSKNGAGTHWVCYASKGNNCFYYDSFGVIPPVSFIQHCKKSGKHLSYNDSQVQRLDTAYCGYWCIDFINNMMQGTSPDDIISRQLEAQKRRKQSDKQELAQTGGSLSQKIARLFKPNAVGNFDLFDLLMEFTKDLFTKNMSVAENRRYQEGRGLAEDVEKMLSELWSNPEIGYVGKQEWIRRMVERGLKKKIAKSSMIKGKKTN